VLFFISPATRRIEYVACTPNPDGRWVRRACPGAARQRPRECREKRPIHGPDRRPPRPSTQDRQLMPEQKDLEFLRTLRPAQQHDQLKQPAQSQINERPAHTHPSELGTAKLPIHVLTPLSEHEPSF
jgi:hypothetical protein